MIFNVTYEKKDITQEINRLVGVPYSFLAKLKKGGIGSERMMVIDASPMIEGLLQYDDQPNFCNMELRPTGIIVYFKYRAETYAWAIPFAKLSLYRSQDNYRIYGEAEYVKVNKAFNGDVLKKFMDKLLEHRAAYLHSISPPS